MFKDIDMYRRASETYISYYLSIYPSIYIYTYTYTCTRLRARLELLLCMQAVIERTQLKFGKIYKN